MSFFVAELVFGYVHIEWKSCAEVTTVVVFHKDAPIINEDVTNNHYQMKLSSDFLKDRGIRETDDITVEVPSHLIPIA